MSATSLDIHLDFRGLKCPLPALRARKALAKAAPGTLLVIACTDPMAAIDLPNLARETGDIFEGEERRSDHALFMIRKRI